MSRNKKPIQNPFGDWPGLEILNDEQGVRLVGGYKAPSAWWSVAFPILLFIAWFIATPVSCAKLDSASGGDLEGNTIVGVFVFWAVVLLALALLGEHFGRKRRLDVRIAPDTIEINGKAYARGGGLNQFVIEEHEKAFSETQAARANQAAGRVFRDAMQVVMRYGERRVPVAAFGRSDVRKAEALLRRLQALNEEGALEALLPMTGQGRTAAPGERDDFGPAKPIR